MFDYDEYASDAANVLDKYNLRDAVDWLINSGTKDAYDIREALSDYYTNQCFGCEGDFL